MISPKLSPKAIYLAVTFSLSATCCFAEDIVLEKGAMVKDQVAARQAIGVTNNTQENMHMIIIECGFYNPNGNLLATSSGFVSDVLPKQRAFTNVEVSIDGTASAETTECRARHQ